jgi:hypothetical protein
VSLIEYLDPSVVSEINSQLGGARRDARSSANRSAAARRKAEERWKRDSGVQLAVERFASRAFQQYMLTALPEELAEQT